MIRKNFRTINAVRTSLLWSCTKHDPLSDQRWSLSKGDARQVSKLIDDTQALHRSDMDSKCTVWDRHQSHSTLSC